MSCLTCGNRTTNYTINGYGVCAQCIGSMEHIPVPIEINEQKSQRMRHILAFMCLMFGIIAATGIAWIGEV